ncbi:MAG: hypothetical protein LAT54_00120 [Cryomorphaceae bacterium]|nr:hypothetical protein [Cryomorphaceae bacterium]
MPIIQRTSTLCAFIFIFASLVGCAPDDTLDVSNIDANVNIHRFDLAFFALDTTDFSQQLEMLKQKGTYDVFFDNQQAESFWRSQRHLDFMNALASDAAKTYPDNKQLQSDIQELWRHYRFLFPQAPKTLNVYTYISGLDFDFPVIYVDSIATLFIALDLFLGQDHPAYAKQADYLNSRHTPNYLLIDIAKTMIDPWLKRRSNDLALINDMIYYGKQIYVVNLLLPSKSAYDVLRYNEENKAFCKDNERMIWRFMIEQDLLFDQRADLKRRFTEEAPFSKFYMEFDNETPGRIGRWLGWRIVSSYMTKYPDKELIELMQMSDHRQLFSQSRYKP